MKKICLLGDSGLSYGRNKFGGHWAAWAGTQRPHWNRRTKQLEGRNSFSICSCKRKTFRRMNAEYPGRVGNSVWGSKA